MKKRLSPRELEVLPYLFVGKTNEEIGICVGCSTLTVKNHVLSISRKLSANNRQHAVYRAIQEGILKMPEIPDAPPVAVIPDAPPVRTAPVTDWRVLGNIMLSEAARVVKCEGHPVNLTAKQFRLLLVMLSAPMHTCQHDLLISLVWGDDFKRGDKSGLAQLRRKLGIALETAGASHGIESIHGFGYRLVERVTA